MGNSTIPGFGSFHEYADAFGSNLSGPVPIFLGRIEQLFSDFFDAIDTHGHFAALKLLTFSYSGIRAATILSIGGASMHAPSLLRTSLEAAAYARLFESSSEWAKSWRERHESEEARRAFRGREASKAVKEELARQGSSLDREYDNLYQLMIDFGAHPNVLGVEAVIDYTELEEGMVHVSFSQLGNNSDRAIAFCIIAQTSLFLLNVMGSIWPTVVSEISMDDRLLNILEEMFAYAKAEGIQTDIAPENEHRE